jgi:hypothetical protein
VFHDVKQFKAKRRSRVVFPVVTVRLVELALAAVEALRGVAAL